MAVNEPIPRRSPRERLVYIALKNCMNVCPGPQELYNSKHMDMSPTRRVCITYTVPCIP